MQTVLFACGCCSRVGAARVWVPLPACGRRCLHVGAACMWAPLPYPTRLSGAPGPRAQLLDSPDRVWGSSSRARQPIARRDVRCVPYSITGASISDHVMAESVMTRLCLTAGVRSKQASGSHPFLSPPLLYAPLPSSPLISPSPLLYGTCPEIFGFSEAVLHTVKKREPLTCMFSKCPEMFVYSALEFSLQVQRPLSWDDPWIPVRCRLRQTRPNRRDHGPIQAS